MFAGLARWWIMTLPGDPGPQPEATAPAVAPAAEGGRWHPLPSPQWSELIHLHHRGVVLSLVATGFEFRAAEELAHEAWARLMEKQQQGRLTELRLPGLAIAQARFLAWEDRRRQALQRTRQVAPTDAAAEQQLVDRHPDPEQRLLNQQQARQALEVVSRAPASAQRLFCLLYAEPTLPHADAARALGLSVQRVRQILCELRKDVRAALEGDRT
jgi:RNA polymerase sigma factor (sigma-70 family)